MHAGNATDGGADRVAATVGALTIPVPWNLQTLLDSIATARGKAIRLMPTPRLGAASQMCGMWIGRAEDDIILYNDATSEYHREQIILHELGHLLLDHHNATDTLATPEVLAQLVPDISVDSVRRVLGRSAFDTEQESQAELFASLIMSQRRRLTRESKLLDTFLAD